MNKINEFKKYINDECECYKNYNKSGSISLSCILRNDKYELIGDLLNIAEKINILIIDDICDIKYNDIYNLNRLSFIFKKIGSDVYNIYETLYRLDSIRIYGCDKNEKTIIRIYKCNKYI